MRATHFIDLAVHRCGLLAICCEAMPTVGLYKISSTKPALKKAVPSPCHSKIAGARALEKRQNDSIRKLTHYIYMNKYCNSHLYKVSIITWKSINMTLLIAQCTKLCYASIKLMHPPICLTIYMYIHQTVQ